MIALWRKIGFMIQCNGDILSKTEDMGAEIEDGSGRGDQLDQQCSVNTTHQQRSHHLNSHFKND